MKKWVVTNVSGIWMPILKKRRVIPVVEFEGMDEEEAMAEIEDALVDGLLYGSPAEAKEEAFEGFLNKYGYSITTRSRRYWIVERGGKKYKFSLPTRARIMNGKPYGIQET